MFGKPTQADVDRAAAYGEWVRRRNPLAIAALVLGVFSLIEFGALIVPGVAGIVLGIAALRQIAGAKSAGARLAWAGIILSVISLGLAAWLYSMRPAGPATQTAGDIPCLPALPSSPSARS